MLNYINLVVWLFICNTLIAQVSVTTAQYNNEGTSANTNETLLTVASVPGISKLGTWTIDGKTYGQPLVRCGVNIGGATCVMVVVTMHASVYVFDAKRPGTAPIWTKSVGTALTQANYPVITDFYGDEVGCIATPAIDTSTNVIGATCVTQEHNWQLYTWNLADGSDFHAPVTLAGTSNGVTFVSANHMCRPATRLFNGNWVVSCSGYGDVAPYQGWMFSYSAATLTQTALWSDVSTVNGQGGLWMSGGGPVFDGTNIYVSTGNGTFTAPDYGTSFVKLTQLLAPTDYATPANYATLNSTDKDINAGKLFVTGNYVIGGGKDGRIFVLDKSGASTMGQLEGVGAGPHQLSNLANGGIFGCTVFADNLLILAGLNTTMKSFSWDAGTGLFNTTPVAFGGSYASPGPACGYSSNGATAGTALLWGVTTALSSFGTVRAGTLRAWNALTLSEVYSSDTAVGDALGNQAKFGMLTVVNGRVYVPTFSNTIALFGFPDSTGMQLTGSMSVSGGFELH